jgi:transposase-like protein
MTDHYTTSERDPTDAAESLRYVFIEKPRCPACGSDELKTLRSNKENDGSVSRDTRCLSCNHQFFVVVE